MNNKIKSYIAICLVTFFWGLSFISTKICLRWFTAFTLAFYRFFLATIILLLIMLVTKSSFKIEKKDIVRTISLGFTGIFLYFAFENMALNLINASLASILIALLPALTVFGNYILLKERVTKYKIISVLLSVFGACLVAGFNTAEGSKNLIFGAILVILSLLSWLVYNYLSMPLQKKYTPIKLTFYQTLFGTIFFALTLPFSHSNFTNFNMSGLINLLFLGILCSALCYLLYNYALNYVDVIICSIFINLIPIITVTASIIILDEKLTLLQYIGSALVVISVVIATFEEQLTKNNVTN